MEIERTENRITYKKVKLQEIVLDDLNYRYGKKGIFVSQDFDDVVIDIIDESKARLYLASIEAEIKVVARPFNYSA